MTEVAKRFDLAFDDYNEFWKWSVANIEDFWKVFVEFLDVRFHDRGDTVLTSHVMPGAHWFPGNTLNYAEQALIGAPDEVVLESHSQTREPVLLTRGQLREQVGQVRRRLVELGVEPGDRVAAYMPNIAETAVVFLASASLGAIFVSCAPEFGTQSVVDRLAQVSPKILFAIDGYRFGSKVVDRVDEVAAIRAALPSVETTVTVPYLDRAPARFVPDSVQWVSCVDGESDVSYSALPFEHPLCILFSSGSTGPPKPIVHGHGGIVIEHLKWLVVHTDINPGDVVFWPTTTAWMTWTVGISTLLCGARALLFDGDITQPDLTAFWRLVGDRAVTHLGVSPPLLAAARRSGLVPAAVADLSRLRVLSSGGSPLSADLFRWVYQAVGSDLMLASVSGGTDVCTSFVGGSPLLPVRAGEITCRFLGTMVEAYDDSGRSVVDQQAELVISEPMPSMPIGFWGDDDGSRLRAAYFERFPGVWCHGDWITITSRGTAEITGRSDATLNRGGVRMGTQEFYSAVEEIDAVTDSLVVHLEDTNDGLGELLMFVSLADGQELDGDLQETIRSTLRKRLSPRHVPDQIIHIRVVPRTITGKRLEVPVKRILGGMAVSDAITGSLATPDALEPFFALAALSRNG